MWSISRNCENGKIKEARYYPPQKKKIDALGRGMIFQRYNLSSTTQPWPRSRHKAKTVVWIPEGKWASLEK